MVRVARVVKFVYKHRQEFGNGRRPRGQGLSRNASSVSFGHARHCFFDSLDTQKFMSEFAEDDFS